MTLNAYRYKNREGNAGGDAGDDADSIESYIINSNIITINL